MSNMRWVLRDSDTYSTSQATDKKGKIFKYEEVEYLNQKINGYAYIEYDTSKGKKRAWAYANDLGTAKPVREVGIIPAGTSFKSYDYPNYPSGNYHGGTDIGSAQGANHLDPVRASFSGKVVKVRSNVAPGTGTSYGNYIAIDSTINGTRYRIYYAHLDSVATNVIKNEYVTKGQVIGYIGNTGKCIPRSYYHLHLEYREYPYSWKVNNVDPRTFY